MSFLLILAGCTRCSDSELDAKPVVTCDAPDHFTSGQAAWVECTEGNGDDDTTEIQMVVSGRQRDGTKFDEPVEGGELDAFTRSTDFDLTEHVALVQPGESVTLVAWAPDADPWTRTIPVLPVDAPGLLMVGLDRENVLEPSRFGEGRNLRVEIGFVPTHRSQGIELFHASGDGSEVTAFLAADGESVFVEAIDDWGEPWSAELDTNGWGRFVRLGIDLSQGGIDLTIDGSPAAGSEVAMSFQGLEDTRPLVALQADGGLAHYWARWDGAGPQFGDLNPCTRANDWDEQRNGTCIAGHAFDEGEVLAAAEDEYLIDTYGDASLVEGAWRFEVYEAP